MCQACAQNFQVLISKKSSQLAPWGKCYRNCKIGATSPSQTKETEAQKVEGEHKSDTNGWYKENSET